MYGAELHTDTDEGQVTCPEDYEQAERDEQAFIKQQHASSKSSNSK
jgi:hypothetical protein